MVNTQKYSDASRAHSLGALRKAAFLAFALALSAFLAGCGEVKAMGEVVLFSELSGKVLDKGKPVGDLTLNREVQWVWGKETITDNVKTSKDGSFFFPAIKRKMFLGSFLPHQPVIDQKISVAYGGKSLLLWSVTKHNYDNNSELFFTNPTTGANSFYRDPAKPMSVTCSLESSPSHRGKIYGLCEVN
jgi:hypothetical protein